MQSTPNLGRAFCFCAAMLCVVGLSACPKDHAEPTHDAGSPNGDGGAGPKAGAGAGGHAAGSGGHAAGSGGKGDAGKGGTGGKAEAGKGGNGGSHDDTDAGVSMGKLCGTRGAGECEAEQFCDFAPDKDCGATDRGGRCASKPSVCTKIFKPVCGCDSHTYGNTCEAHSVGVSVKHDESCTRDECTGIGGRVASGTNASCKTNEDQFSLGDKPEPALCCVAKTSAGKTCGGIAALPCGAKEFCNYDMGQGCDGTVADAAGKCQAKPDGCTDQYQPVCSCDRKTQGNECSAHSSGASVLHTGACTVSDCDKIGGRVAVGTGPAAMCNKDEIEHTHIINDDGSMAIEGMLCCVKK